MPATATLSTTTLAYGVSAADRVVKLASTSGLTPGSSFIFADGELMRVVSLDAADSSAVYVKRGDGGTVAVPHAYGVTCYIGTANQFYRTDPVGRPPEAVLVSPWINVANGSIWFAQGDPLPGAARWWEKQALTVDVGPLGIKQFSYSPTSST